MKSLILFLVISYSLVVKGQSGDTVEIFSANIQSYLAENSDILKPIENSDAYFLKSLNFKVEIENTDKYFWNKQPEKFIICIEKVSIYKVENKGQTKAFCLACLNEKDGPVYAAFIYLKEMK